MNGRQRLRPRTRRNGLIARVSSILWPRHRLDVHLLDGTYELFRYFFAVPSHVAEAGREVGATRGVLGSVLSMLEGGVTHLGVATDRVIVSFRNRMWPRYKTGEGTDQRLLQQFPLLEEGLVALGVKLWPMVELEADDALASAAARAAEDPRVDHVYVCSPDKDLAQCVRDGRVLQLERRTGKVSDEAGVVAKFGIPPRAIPDYLALVGDSADGFPGLPGWGARAAAAVLARYGSLEAIPTDPAAWDIPVRGAGRLCETLIEQRDNAFLFRDLATLRTDAPVFDSIAQLRWQGPRETFADYCAAIHGGSLATRAFFLARKR